VTPTEFLEKRYRCWN